MENKHSQAIPAEALGEAQKRLNEAIEALKPYIINLSAQERQNQLKLGDKTLAFAEKAFEFAESNPDFAPSYFDMAEYAIDMKDTTSMRVLLVTLEQLRQGVSDTMMAAGGDAYNHSLIYYNAVKQAANQNVPGAKAIYSELRERFPGGRPKKKTE
ncbi:MAG: hypothetical protein LBU91_07030 [Bacteroidales bacterium]|jgi:hypothetical protein|nr:hypothetical protein [Bacteroidales bacterium]